MKKIEAPFTTKLKVWMKYNMKFTYGWEVKYPKNKNYYFDSDKSFAKELRNLLIWQRCFIHKWSDISMLGTPHDGFTAWCEPSYFFFTWDGKNFYVVSAITIKGLIDDGKKSISEEQAKSLASFSGVLK
jgi:hypothetical protein